MISKFVLFLLIESHVSEFISSFAGTWFEAPPMQPMICYHAVSYLNKIFVVGNMFNDFDSYMVAQVYDPELNSWSSFDAPNHYRSDFAFVEHHGKLYIIGGADRYRPIKTVEIFDFVKNSWDSAPDLPYAFDDPEVVILNDSLIVYDSFADMNIFTPITWCEKLQSWKPLNKPPTFKEHLFCPINDEVEIRAMLRDLRDPAANFERSPFEM